MPILVATLSARGWLPMGENTALMALLIIVVPLVARLRAHQRSGDPGGSVEGSDRG
jgi:hypothetical protein